VLHLHQEERKRKENTKLQRGLNLKDLTSQPENPSFIRFLDVKALSPGVILHVVHNQLTQVEESIKQTNNGQELAEEKQQQRKTNRRAKRTVVRGDLWASFLEIRTKDKRQRAKGKGQKAKSKRQQSIHLVPPKLTNSCLTFVSFLPSFLPSFFFSPSLSILISIFIPSRLSCLVPPW